mgnify:CR=1 FL=1
MMVLVGVIFRMINLVHVHIDGLKMVFLDLPIENVDYVFH